MLKKVLGSHGRHSDSIPLRINVSISFLIQAAMRPAPCSGASAEPEQPELPLDGLEALEVDKSEVFFQLHAFGFCRICRKLFWILRSELRIVTCGKDRYYQRHMQEQVACSLKLGIACRCATAVKRVQPGHRV